MRKKLYVLLASMALILLMLVPNVHALDLTNTPLTSAIYDTWNTGGNVISNTSAPISFTIGGADALEFGAIPLITGTISYQVDFHSEDGGIYSYRYQLTIDDPDSVYVQAVESFSLHVLFGSQPIPVSIYGITSAYISDSGFAPSSAVCETIPTVYGPIPNVITWIFDDWEVDDGDGSLVFAAVTASSHLGPVDSIAVGDVSWKVDLDDWNSDQLVGVKAPIPEPTTLLLFGTGLIGLAGLSRRKFFKK